MRVLIFILSYVSKYLFSSWVDLVGGLTVDAHDLITDKKYDHLAALGIKTCHNLWRLVKRRIKLKSSHMPHTQPLVYIYICVRPNQNDILVSARRCCKLSFHFTLWPRRILKGNKKLCVLMLSARRRAPLYDEEKSYEARFKKSI